MSETPSKPLDLAGRVFENFYFAVSWAVFIGAVFIFVGLPFQRALVVLWVRGSDAYFQKGIRVLRGKPVKFSDGLPVPSLPDAATGFAVFMVTAVGLSLLLFFFYVFMRDILNASYEPAANQSCQPPPEFRLAAFRSLFASSGCTRRSAMTTA